MAESVPLTTPQQQQYPDLNPYASSNDDSTATPASSSIANNAQAAMDSVKNSQTVQTIANGPVAEKARAEASATKNEISNLASARTTPAATTATGQNLTHYHSFFYNLLSWENPRATALSYVTVVLFIITTRYVPVVKYGLKALYITLGITAAAEASGKLFFEQGFASKLRPNKYYTIPRETLESMVEDFVELLNFFVIEFQRIIFAENVVVTAAAFTTLFITYFLIKITPAWGLALLFTTITYFAPLVYITNKDLIDTNLNSAADVVAAQTQQVRDLASAHTGKAFEMSQSALRDASARASEMVGQAKQTAVEKGVVSQETAEKLPGGGAAVTAAGATTTTTSAATTTTKSEDFPTAPKTDPAPAVPSASTPAHTENPVAS